MSRTVYAGEVVVDQLPVWEDSTTKKTGLTAGNFTVSVFRNGVAMPGYSVTVSEIGSSGWYSVTFTPSSAGFWLVEVVNDFNGETWGEEFDVVAPTILGVV